ncbi:MAG: diguanylate cyclase [Marinospirillum sp.]|uniref:diguanylate cyclase domain-containing protein n=1 Tax=Marinospirillum sp. TaxID=2183934 RepID=UPI0019FE76DD|nr:diguanylate cyclase [Marinospirillum sp.]MBE0508524.1 diguanylate cyclase [Marinospirillum sp.]
MNDTWGHEVVVLLPQITTANEPAQVMDKLAAVVAQPFPLDATTLQISASLGLAIYPQHAESASELLQRADKAMYLHKASHKSKH